MIAILIIFTNEWIFSTVANSYQPKPVILNDSTQYECGILLGGMSMFDKNDKGYFSESADRFLQTVKLYHQKKIKKILITGGSGHMLKKEKSEALFIAPELIASGVSANDIIIESKSKNTYENAVFSKNILDTLHMHSPYLLITSALHMPRAQKTFEHAGIHADIYPCNYLTVHEKVDVNFLFVPKIEMMYKWQIMIKEWVGLAAYKWTGKT